MENIAIAEEEIEDDESFDPHTLENYSTIISEGVAEIFIQTRNVQLYEAFEELLEERGYENCKQVIQRKLNELLLANDDDDPDRYRRDNPIDNQIEANYNNPPSQEQVIISSADPFDWSQQLLPAPPTQSNFYINTNFSEYYTVLPPDFINSSQSEPVNFSTVISSQNLFLSEYQIVNPTQQLLDFNYPIVYDFLNFPIPSQNYTTFNVHVEPVNFPVCCSHFPFILQSSEHFKFKPTTIMSQDENGSSDMSSNNEDNNTSNDDEGHIEVGEVLIDLDDNLKGKLVDDFACICDCSLEVARETLIHHNWNMQSAIDAFLEQESEGENQDDSTDNMEDNTVSNSTNIKSVNEEEKSTIVQSSSSQSSSLQSLSSPKPSSTPGFSVLSPAGTTTWAPEKFTIISWNVDGLDNKNLEKRTDAVIEAIEKNNYSIVFLQELLPYTFDYIARRLNSKYLSILGTEDPECPYLIATFLRRNHIIYEDHYIVNYPNSKMARNVLVTQAFTGRAKLALLNTHLESTADFAEERKNQLRQCFEICRSFAPEYNVLFGGDLNLRDKEVVGIKPHNMVDLWETCGQRESCRYTWDLTRNTNKQMPSRYQPRARFDRLYFRNSELPTIEPEFFGVTGIEKVTGTQSFPSDHWAILSAFRLKQDARKPIPKKRKATDSSTS